ncbi:hypothetical protein [Rhizobium sp. S163]|uniref:hypothetical protein n=1 Tax=Rhizobium sp. S163 TaxID=3055039 RepID=UPI0025A9EA58|nr:hypothetical protein [Rhizobium sp. S163]MDM9643854.1 hypothetical protein [Rhizobium sp. S163]
MTWNTNIQEAPRGKTVQITRKKRVETKEAVDTTFRTTYEHQKEDVILATKCGKVIKTYWIPGEERWAGLANGEQPDAWMAWPKHPNFIPAGETGMVLGTERERPLSIGLHTDGDPESRFDSASLHQHSIIDDCGSGA